MIRNEDIHEKDIQMLSCYSQVEKIAFITCSRSMECYNPNSEKNLRISFGSGCSFLSRLKELLRENLVPEKNQNHSEIKQLF